jgi:hypothetical protein
MEGGCVIPVKQRNRHDPANGIYGDCHRAAIASLLELPLNEVPHFCDADSELPDAEPLMERERKWLASRGLTNINVIYPGEVSLDDLLTAIDATTPGIMFILGGTSTTGCGHSVVAGCGKILHDPSLTKTGDHSIVGPMEDGYWWVTFMGTLTARSFAYVSHRPPGKEACLNSMVDKLPDP